MRYVLLTHSHIVCRYILSVMHIDHHMVRRTFITYFLIPFISISYEKSEHTPNSDCQIRKHCLVWMNVYYENNLCLAHALTHTPFSFVFEWWKWTFIGWIEWVGIFIFESTPFTNIERALLVFVWASNVRSVNSHSHAIPFMYVHCYFQFLMG